jgi:di/tripeptidase
MTDDNVEIHCLIRSLIDSGKDYVVSMLDSLGKLAGAKTQQKADTRLAAGCQLSGYAPGS